MATHIRVWLTALLLISGYAPSHCTAGPISDLDSLYQLGDTPTRQVNSLWLENPPEKRLGDGRTKVTIADLKGPGLIVMLHFAMPATLRLDRSVVLRMYWDGETNPSLEAPLVDFFCDPNGQLESVNSILVNKRRGWNCYFPMPFAKAARIEIEQQDPRYPNGNWYLAPCYSYVLYRPLRSLPKDSGYFHAHWRQGKMYGSKAFQVLDAYGKGNLIGWSTTVRGISSPTAPYAVDQNQKIYIDGEQKPSLEWQGLEDFFGFSWGFPEASSRMPYTGFDAYYNGAAAYRFLVADRIPFAKSMKFAVGPGDTEVSLRNALDVPGGEMEFSSVAYWYQTEPHRAFEPLPDVRVRAPSLISSVRETPHDANDAVVINCGNPHGDVGYLKAGWDFVFTKGFGYAGWKSDINHCWAGSDTVEFSLLCPVGSQGTVKLLILDSDSFGGGRKESISIAGRNAGEFENFQQGKWIDFVVTTSDTTKGQIPVVIKNLNPQANAVVSQVRFVESVRR